jgi:outer membrane biosynthesis protein TonB
VARAVAIPREPLERREFRRLLVVSALAHAALGLFLGFSPGGEIVMPQGVIAVELVSSPAPAAPAKAAPRPRPAPPAPPPAPKQVVLPKEPAPPPAPKAAAEPKPAPRPEPKPEPTAEPAGEKDYADVLSELREEAGDEAPAPAPAQTAAIGSPTGSPVSPEFLAWERRARIHIRQNWVVPPSFRNQPLRTSILVELDSGGAVVGEPRIVTRSGNPWYDDGVVRSIQKASPLPAPPEAGDWSFVFVADESY